MRRRQPISSKILKSSRARFCSHEQDEYKRDSEGKRHRITRSLTDWHVDSKENDKGAMAEHCALHGKRDESSLEPAAAPFIYLTLSSFARTSVSSLLTHSMPETNECTMLKIRMFDPSSYPFPLYAE